MVLASWSIAREGSIKLVVMLKYILNSKKEVASKKES